MQKKDGFDLQKLDKEVDALLTDVRELLDAGVSAEASGQMPQGAEQAQYDTDEAAAASMEETVIFKPLTFYEQSKPAYQTARRAQYEREREQQRLERERLQREREEAEAQKMQELEQRRSRGRRKTPAPPPEDSQAYAQWLYEQGEDEQTAAQREALRNGKIREEKTPRKKRRALRAFVLLLCVCVIASLALIVFARQPLAEQPLGERRKNCSTILIAGTDSGGYRTDAMMLVTVDRERGSIALVSIPRDTLVFSEYAVPKLNSAYGWAGGGEDGMQELLKRVEEIVGFAPDGYVRIDLAGFSRLVDQMGGISFDVPMDMHYQDPMQDLTIDLKAGLQTLSGEQALQLARYRSGYADQDLGRVTMQRALLSEALCQWVRPSRLLRLPGVMQVLKTSSDTNLTAAHLLWLAQSAMLCDLDSIRTATLPGQAVYVAGGWYYILDATGVAETVNTYCNPYIQGVAVSDLSIRVG